MTIVGHWTKDAPTKPGFYGARMKTQCKPEPVRVNESCVEILGTDELLDVEDFEYWTREPISFVLIYKES